MNNIRCSFFGVQQGANKELLASACMKGCTRTYVAPHGWGLRDGNSQRDLKADHFAATPAR